MSQPTGFSWVEKPLLAGMARPDGVEECVWLRQQGIELLIALTEDPPPRHWINEAGLMLAHHPVQDFTAPSQEELDKIMGVMQRAHENNLGVGVSCGAGLGRTGTVLACYFVTKGLSAKNAIARVRRLRPGSIEIEEQEQAVEEFDKRRMAGDEPSGSVP
jgi:atypical dual specificity phosphatase